jgi:GDP-L-fucose synthase
MNQAIDGSTDLAPGILDACPGKLGFEFPPPELSHLGGAIKDLTSQIGAGFFPARLRFPGGANGVAEILARGAAVIGQVRFAIERTGGNHATAFSTRKFTADVQLVGLENRKSNSIGWHRLIQRIRGQSGKCEKRDATIDVAASVRAVQAEETIFIAGHRGLAGGAILREFQDAGYSRLLTHSRSELDLRERDAVRTFFSAERPAIVVVAAAKVGGIKANNDFPVEFLIENLRIQNNVIEAAADFGARKLLFLGSSCIYPKFAPQPIPESSLLTGTLEPTNEPYALAKIAGIKLCQAYAREYGKHFISAMPTNLYGPGDNFDLNNSHVLPALLRKVHEARQSGAKEVVVWGTGSPRREFLHVADLAAACRFLLENYDSPEIVNIGCGEDVTIRELAELICEVVGFDGELVFDASKPDGTPRKLLDVSRLTALGWKSRISLREGIVQTYDWYRKQKTN